MKISFVKLKMNYSFEDFFVASSWLIKVEAKETNWRAQLLTTEVYTL